MEQKGPSRTAIQTAVHRAAHNLLDDDPKILVDPFARAFAGYASDDELLSAPVSVEMTEFPRMRVVFTLRSRYAEDELAKAVTRGIDQYIILGAGLDSFAYRCPILCHRSTSSRLTIPQVRPGNARGSRNLASWHQRACIMFPPTSSDRHLAKVSWRASST